MLGCGCCTSPEIVSKNTAVDASPETALLAVLTRATMGLTPLEAGVTVADVIPRSPAILAEMPPLSDIPGRQTALPTDAKQAISKPKSETDRILQPVTTTYMQPGCHPALLCDNCEDQTSSGNAKSFPFENKAKQDEEAQKPGAMHTPSSAARLSIAEQALYYAGTLGTTIRGVLAQLSMFYLGSHTDISQEEVGDGVIDGAMYTADSTPQGSRQSLSLEQSKQSLSPDQSRQSLSLDWSRPSLSLDWSQTSRGVLLRAMGRKSEDQVCA